MAHISDWMSTGWVHLWPFNSSANMRSLSCLVHNLKWAPQGHCTLCYLEERSSLCHLGGIGFILVLCKTSIIKLNTNSWMWYLSGLMWLGMSNLKTETKIVEFSSNIVLWFFRRSLFILKLGSYQFALLKLVLTILSIVLWSNGNFSVADVSIHCANIWIPNFTRVQNVSFSDL